MRTGTTISKESDQIYSPDSLQILPNLAKSGHSLYLEDVLQRSRRVYMGAAEVGEFALERQNV